MPLFFHDTFMFRDPAGRGVFLQEHQYEHTQFVTLGLDAPTREQIPDYDLASWGEGPHFERAWLSTHQTVHDILRSFTGVNGVDLSEVDLNDEKEFYIWLEDHRAEHAALRAAFGITT